MSCSQEFIQAQLDERRRTTDHLHLLQAVAHTREEQTPGRPQSPFAAPYRFAHRAIRRCLAWLSASQLGPLPNTPDPLDPLTPDHRDR